MRLILNDGTVIEGGSGGLSDGFLWLWLPNWTMRQAVEIAFNESIIGKIIFQYGEEEEVWTGFVDCVSIDSTGNNEIALCFKKR